MIALLFLLTQYLYIYTGCFNIHGTHVITNNSTNNNVVLFFVSDLKRVYYNNYINLITMPLTREVKYFESLIARQNNSKMCKQNFTVSLT